MANTLIIKHQTKEEVIEGFKEQMDSKEELPHVVSFKDPDELGRILTNRRVELIEAIMNEEPESIRDLARKLDRGLREVHEDVTLLEQKGIIQLIQDGRAKKPTTEYDKIKIEIELPRTTKAKKDRAIPEN